MMNKDMNGNNDGLVEDMDVLYDASDEFDEDILVVTEDDVDGELMDITEDGKEEKEGNKLLYSPEAKQRSIRILRLRHFVDGATANKRLFDNFLSKVCEASGTSLPGYAIASLLTEEPDADTVISAYKATGAYKTVCSDELIAKIEAKAETYPAIIACNSFVAGLIEHRIPMNGKCYDTIKKSGIFTKDSDITKYIDRAVNFYGGSRDVTKKDQEPIYDGDEYDAYEYDAYDMEDDVYDIEDEESTKKRNRNFPPYERYLMDFVSSTVSLYFDLTLQGEKNIRWGDWIEYLTSIRDAIATELKTQIWTTFGYIPPAYVADVKKAIRDNIHDVAELVSRSIAEKESELQKYPAFSTLYYALSGLYDDMYPFRGDTGLTFKDVIDYTLSLDVECPSYLQCYHYPKETMRKINMSGPVGKRACARAIMDAYYSDDPKYVQWSKDTLFDLYQGFIGLVVKRSSKSAPGEYNVLYQIGVESVLRNMSSYDPEIALPTTFFATRIMHDVKDTINRERTHVSSQESTNINRVKAAQDRLSKAGIPITIAALVDEVNSEGRVGKNAKLSYRQVQTSLELMHRGNHVSIDDDTIASDHKDMERDAYLYLEDTSSSRQPENAVERSFFLRMFEKKLHCLPELEQIAFMAKSGLEIRRGELICVKDLSFTKIMKMLRKRPEFAKVTTKDIETAYTRTVLYLSTDPELQHWQRMSNGDYQEDTDNTFFISFHDEDEGFGMELFDVDEVEPVDLRIPDSAIDAMFSFM